MISFEQTARSEVCGGWLDGLLVHPRRNAVGCDYGRMGGMGETPKSVCKVE
jgi:hypothetical protein